MGWNELSGNWKGAIGGAGLGFLISLALGIIGEDSLIFAITTLLFSLIGGITGWIIGSLLDKEEPVINETDKTTLKRKYIYFYLFIVPIILFLISIILLIFSFVSGVVICALANPGIEFKTGSITIAVCQETIPMLTTPIPLLIIGISIFVYFAKKEYNKIDKRIEPHTTQ